MPRVELFTELLYFQCAKVCQDLIDKHWTYQSLQVRYIFMELNLRDPDKPLSTLSAILSVLNLHAPPQIGRSDKLIAENVDGNEASLSEHMLPELNTSLGSDCTQATRS